MASATPREKRQKRTREEILASALELVSERGPDKVSLREIARRVNYSPSGLYEYFAGKDDILQALCGEGDDLLRRFLEAEPTSLPIDRYIVALGKAYLAFSRAHREHFQLMFSRQIREAGVHLREVKPDGAYRVVLAAVQRGIDEGAFPTRPGFGLQEIAFGLWAVAHGLAILPVEIPEAEETILATFLRGLRTQPDADVPAQEARA